jgi:hypothetical protein
VAVPGSHVRLHGSTARPIASQCDRRRRATVGRRGTRTGHRRRRSRQRRVELRGHASLTARSPHEQRPIPFHASTLRWRRWSSLAARATHARNPPCAMCHRHPWVVPTIHVGIDGQGGMDVRRTVTTARTQQATDVWVDVAFHLEGTQTARWVVVEAGHRGALLSPPRRGSSAQWWSSHTQHGIAHVRGLRDAWMSRTLRSMWQRQRCGSTRVLGSV